MQIECASNPDSIHFATFHIAKMQCALSNRIITQSTLCILYIESNSISQHGDAPSYFKIMLFFALASLGCITNTNWRENEENIWRRKELKKRKLSLRRKQQFRRDRFNENSLPRSWRVAETFSYTTFIVPRNAIKLILYILFSQNDYKNFRRFIGPASQLPSRTYRAYEYTQSMHGLRSGAVSYAYRCSIHFKPPLEVDWAQFTSVHLNAHWLQCTLDMKCPNVHSMCIGF